MKNKLSNKTINELKDLAKLIPVTYDEVESIRVITGSQLIMNGIFEVKGNPVKEKGQYSYPIKHKMRTDHFKKIKKLYAKEGIDAVRKYAYSSRELIVESAAPRMIGGIMTMPC